MAAPKTPTVNYERRKLTGAELEFFERVTSSMLQARGLKQSKFKTYQLALTKEGFEQLVRAFLRCGGTLNVPAFEQHSMENR